MNDKKIIGIVKFLFIFFTVMVLSIISYHIREYSYKNAIKQSENTSELVKNGLTAHMVNGIMDKKNTYIQQLKDTKHVKNLWVVQSEKNAKQFKKELLSEDKAKDFIDKTVLENGETYVQLNESLSEASVRVTIPYKATSYGQTNCMQCHNAKEGDVLGAVSIEMDINEERTSGFIMLLQVMFSMLLFNYIIVTILGRSIQPYFNLMNGIKRVLHSAYQGEYSARFVSRNANSLENEPNVKDTISWINNLMEKLEHTLNIIDKNLSTFIIIDNNEKNKDKLIFSQKVIENLHEIYKYKKTIEVDKNINEVMNRLYYILKINIGIDDFVVYKTNYDTKSSEILFTTDNYEFICPKMGDNFKEDCRCNRISNIVKSEDFNSNCPLADKNSFYFCLPYKIDDRNGLTITINSENKEKYDENQKKIPLIIKYLDETKPILESKILTAMLEEKNMIDGLTGFYNRKFIDTFIDTKMNKGIYQTFAIAMFDIDYFKKVNDSYGHDAGDEVIRELTEIITNHLYENDYAVRYGGEEFFVIFPDIDNIQERLENIRKTFENTTFNLSGNKFQKTVSIGYSIIPDDNPKFWHGLKFADIALYEAKENGRNRIIKYDSKLSKNKEY